MGGISKQDESLSGLNGKKWCILYELSVSQDPLSGTMLKKRLREKNALFQFPARRSWEIFYNLDWLKKHELIQEAGKTPLNMVGRQGPTYTITAKGQELVNKPDSAFLEECFIIFESLLALKYMMQPQIANNSPQLIDKAFNQLNGPAFEEKLYGYRRYYDEIKDYYEIHEIKAILTDILKKISSPQGII